MTKLKKYILISLSILGGIILIPIIGLFLLYITADMKQPDISINTSEYKVISHTNYTQCNNSLLKQNSYGVWELYLEGNAQERGASMGAITQDLMKYQEEVFVNQIKEIIPSESYLSFLRYLLIAFNRNLAGYIPQEYREEIYGASVFCSDEYNAIGTPYERQLNYHAAHDIGHTMQQYMLVGCSSFGAWDNKSKDSALIIGRNFDFYVGDDFAKNKLISFYNPSEGFKFASIGWPGMIGVLSGINEKGLSVTINAAKGSMPVSSATPISILTREILQYASNIEQAYTIASNYKTFVSESILIGSALDSCAAIIEKTPAKTILYNSDTSYIICTNHFQSLEFDNDKHNIENIATSDSKYRWDRLSQLLNNTDIIDFNSAAQILRDQKGVDGSDIGLCNEKSINQSIAHHSVIFNLYELKMWVTTKDWLGGEYICYNLDSLFQRMDNKLDFKDNLYNSTLTIKKDSIYIMEDLPRIKNYREGISTIKKSIKNNTKLEDKYLDNFVLLNPNNYLTWKIVGDYYKSIGSLSLSADFYEIEKLKYSN